MGDGFYHGIFHGNFLNPWDDVYHMIPRHWKNVNGKNHPQMANDLENKGGLYYQLTCIRRAIVTFHKLF